MAGQRKKKFIPKPEISKKPFLAEFEDLPNLTSDQIKSRIQELRVHQSELESQNGNSEAFNQSWNTHGINIKNSMIPSQ